MWFYCSFFLQGSNPSSSDLFSRDINDFEEMQSENEEKAEVAAPRRTRKCRRATATKKYVDLTSLHDLIYQFC
jgi:hypothetical protein